MLRKKENAKGEKLPGEKISSIIEEACDYLIN